jgi:superfamily II DNA or RNA helicase
MVTVISDVGMIGGGIPINPRARVTCCTVGSLHRVLVREWDIIFFDEVHQAPTDDCAYKLGQLRGAPRLFGFSASHGDRGDNKDLITESIFGPVRLAVSFEEAVAHGMIVPIEVIVRPVNLDINPCAGCHPAIKERLAYWTNTPRNQMVIEDARAYPDVPVLVTCKTIEHLANLKALCPEMVTIHAPNGMTEEERERYVVDGLWPADEPALSVEMYEQRMARLRSGVPGIYGINSKGFVGLNAKKIAVVVRADGAGSKTLDTQIPGRAVRVLDPEEGDKTVALIHDYSDNFDRGCHNKSTRRITNYETNNFKVSQRRPKSLLRRLGKK